MLPAAEFEQLQTEFASMTAANVSKEGGMAGLAKRGYTLDQARWDKLRLNIMRELIASKYQKHQVIRDILTLAEENNMYLVYSSRSDHYWGADLTRTTTEQGPTITGDNQLGKLYMEHYRKVPESSTGMTIMEFSKSVLKDLLNSSDFAVDYEGYTYRTVEHAIQLQKYLHGAVKGKTSALPKKVSAPPEKVSALPEKVSAYPGKASNNPGKASNNPATYLPRIGENLRQREQRLLLALEDEKRSLIRLRLDYLFGFNLQEDAVVSKFNEQKVDITRLTAEHSACLQQIAEIMTRAADNPLSFAGPNTMQGAIDRHENSQKAMRDQYKDYCQLEQNGLPFTAHKTAQDAGRLYLVQRAYPRIVESLSSDNKGELKED